MKTITVDGKLESLLAHVRDLAAVCDQTGLVLGYYMPSEPDPKAARHYVCAAARIDPAEIKRRKETEKGGHTLGEIMQYLHSLEKA